MSLEIISQTNQYRVVMLLDFKATDGFSSDQIEGCLKSPPQRHWRAEARNRSSTPDINRRESTET